MYVYGRKMKIYSYSFYDLVSFNIGLLLACRPSLTNFNVLAGTGQQVQLPPCAVMLCRVHNVVFTVSALCLRVLFVHLRSIEALATKTGRHCFAPTVSDRLGEFK